MQFNHLVLGGTFDHFHAGHRCLIDEAFKRSQNVIIGIVKDHGLYKNKILPQSIESFAIRKKSLVGYLIKNNYLQRAEIIPIFDIYGITLIDKNLEAIIVSAATYKNALKINNKRKKKKLRPLKIIRLPFVLADDGKSITSERIRAGEIDREGESYWAIFKNKKQLTLPQNLRVKLRKPIGKIFLTNNNNWSKTASKIIQLINQLNFTIVVAVGDIVASSLIKAGFNPHIKIIDFRTRREKIKDKKFLIKNDFKFKVKNQPGTVNIAAVGVIKSTINRVIKQNKKETIVVDGEEDLLTLPALLFAPLGSLVLYGQMDLGAVVVEVSEEKKYQVKKLLNKFI